MARLSWLRPPPWNAPSPARALSPLSADRSAALGRQIDWLPRLPWRSPLPTPGCCSPMIQSVGWYSASASERRDRGTRQPLGGQRQSSSEGSSGWVGGAPSPAGSVNLRTAIGLWAVAISCCLPLVVCVCCHAVSWGNSASGSSPFMGQGVMRGESADWLCQDGNTSFQHR